VSNTVINIRKSKLPDPDVIGNAGSFFKNPVLDQNLADALKKEYPTAPIYPFENQLFKVPAAWLIEHCNWKGKKLGGAGVHEQQALVIINHSNASGEEIFSLAQRICNDVNEKFGIQLMREVSMIA
jgi:UDP-N-acetylmuramate dehydrogenase